MIVLLDFCTFKNPFKLIATCVYTTKLTMSSTEKKNKMEEESKVAMNLKINHF